MPKDGVIICFVFYVKFPFRWSSGG